MWTRNGHCSHHALIGLHPFNKLWKCWHVAYLPLSRQPVKVYPCQTIIFCCAPPCIYPEGKCWIKIWLSHKFSCCLSAQWFYTRFLQRNIWYDSNCWCPYVPPMRINAICLVHPSRWQIHRCLWKQLCHHFPWWDSKTGLPSVLYILSRLSWEVCQFYFHATVLIQFFRVLLCCVWYLGNFPCPHCLVHASEVHKLGMKRDFKWWEMKIWVDDERRHMLVETAWEMIYEHGVWPGADNISELLGSKALTPTQVRSQYFLMLSATLFFFSTIQNAFSDCLSKYGLNFHSMFVVNLLHEFELGVWKATFMHLLQILYAQGGDSIQTLNKRLVFIFLSLTWLTLCQGTKTSPHLAVIQFASSYTMHQQWKSRLRMILKTFSRFIMLITTFVKGTNHFQCSIPVFDGLLDPNNNIIIMDLLFELATWHGLAKLCLHTKSTVCTLESSTTWLGIALRKFQSTTCAEFVTCHLPSEEAAWGCWKAAKAKLQPTTQKSKSKGKEPISKGKKKVSSTLRAFGLSNYKTHALPDYAKTIQEFGTMDGYSTQNVSSLSKLIPRWS